MSDLLFTRTADAEQAKSTGGMLALFPRQDDAMLLAVPGGEPPEDLHVTLLYFGQDVTNMPPPSSTVLGPIAERYPHIVAEAFAHAQFNPHGGMGGDKEPCAVYLIGNSLPMAELHVDLVLALDRDYDMSTQHAPWSPHLTAGYQMDVKALSYTGPVHFDRLGLRWAGESVDYPLL